MILSKGMLPTVYMIDKDPAVIDMISLLLADEGYQPILSVKPFEIEHLKKSSPSLILLHNGLDNEGLGICREIKADPEISMIPLIMSSTRADLPIVAAECGAEAHILKPFDIYDFCSLIKRILETGNRPSQPVT